ncbi:hypothetical protein TUM4444_10950 [Shewanella sp. MBTL60-112-B1]|nr:hypothetical protein TUM4444_10950 [Shewanella sp. MBTL60-112-B1]
MAKVISVMDDFNSKDFISHDEKPISFPSDALTTGKFTSGITAYCLTSKINDNGKAVKISRTGKS